MTARIRPGPHVGLCRALENHVARSFELRVRVGGLAERLIVRAGGVGLRPAAGVRHRMRADLVAVLDRLLHPRPQEPDLQLIEEALFRRRILLGADEERALDVVLVHRIGDVDHELRGIVDAVDDDGASVVEVFGLPKELDVAGLRDGCSRRAQRDDRRTSEEAARGAQMCGSQLKSPLSSSAGIVYARSSLGPMSPEGTERTEKIHKRRNGANGDDTEKNVGARAARSAAAWVRQDDRREHQKRECLASAVLSHPHVPTCGRHPSPRLFVFVTYVFSVSSLLAPFLRL